MDYAEKINALLAKADSTTHPEEREAFIKGAERLMVRWGVSDAMLEDAAQRDSGRTAQQVEQRRFGLVAKIAESWRGAHGRPRARSARASGISARSVPRSRRKAGSSARRGRAALSWA